MTFSGTVLYDKIFPNLPKTFTTAVYYTGDTVIYNSNVYKCIKDYDGFNNTILPTNTTYWEKIDSFYIRYENGLIIQWGKQVKSTSVSGGSNSSGTAITFPLAFTFVPAVIITHFDGNQFNMTASSVTNTGFTPVYRNVNTNTSATTSGCSWIAIGF